MSERWKPKHGEAYYFFDSASNIESECYEDDYVWDKGRITIGNCFRTEAEAEAAAEKVKALLLGLHDNNLATNLQDKQDKLQDKPLPKLTAEVFDRPDCPEWAKYAAVDRCGVACFFDEKPLCDLIEMWLRGENGEYFRAVRNSKFDASDWQNSLIVRPSELPDWCKIGEWVWATTFKTYFKVDEVDALFIGGKGLFGDDYSVKVENVRQARLRPYNEVEMRGLVGMVVCRGSSIHFVTGYEDVLDGVSMVHVNGCLYNANDLLQKGFTYDTRPCGRLEHLENGEWVK